jgi:hypothetical protein
MGALIKLAGPAEFPIVQRILKDFMDNTLGNLAIAGSEGEAVLVCFFCDFQ